MVVECAEQMQAQPKTPTTMTICSLENAEDFDEADDMLDREALAG